jgi:hypothetical protein
VIDFGQPVGPATHARRHLRPTERLLWATFGAVLNYDVNGLTRLGQPDRSAIRKVGEGVGGFILDGLIDGDGGSDRPADPQVIAFGDQVPEFLRGLTPEAFRVWALTSHRLMVIDGVVPEREPEPERSLFAKAVGFGKDVAEIFTARTKTYGENREGEPVPMRETAVRADVHRPQIAGFAVAKRGRRPCFRMSLVDGSGVDFLLDGQDPAVFGWMLALTNGTV